MMKRMNHHRVGLQEIGMTDLVVRNALRKTSRARDLRYNAHDLSNAVRPDLSHTRAMLHQAVTEHISQQLLRAKAGCAIGRGSTITRHVRCWFAQPCLHTYPGSSSSLRTNDVRAARSHHLIVNNKYSSMPCALLVVTLTEMPS